ncbi:helix-turn-helix domain-containing protein [Collinsella sp. zg1085]|nr:helix-turn-helix domain-containing protein [Collinsella sp. zg1085]
MELETMLLEAGKSSSDIIRATGHTAANISKLKNGKVRAIRFKTLLDICEELNCQPGDIIKCVTEEELEALAVERARNAVERMKGDSSKLNLPTNVYAVDLSDE